MCSVGFSFGVARKCNRFAIHSLATIMMISLLCLGVRFKNSWGTSACGSVRISGDRTFRHTSTLSQQPLYFCRLLQLFSHCFVIVIYSIMGGFSIAHFLVTLIQMRGVSNFPLPWCFSHSHSYCIDFRLIYCTGLFLFVKLN